jgi:hypothetical protein
MLCHFDVVLGNWSFRSSHRALMGVRIDAGLMCRSLLQL